ncbi:Mu transposase C-terminal domain-containing protein [Azospirillum sp. TSO22-1]|uniref:Mu transposase C-terminal domain-containing protein n=1 Tax=Azospirillum sp. TSO22-1 TaxID=716789 RepID=UPI000D616D7A|nr:Mu transposase C-terminal domain-containing protein [Azospirillum sp. TSO22-1]PWC54827.1 hypothetical protein TSO221_06915 [Azospirillum sp. TSO22-1]
MATAYLRRGTVVVWDERSYVLAGRTSTGLLRFEEEETGDYRTCTVEELATACAAATARVVAANGNSALPEELRRRLATSVASLSEAAQKAMARKQAYVAAAERMPEAKRRSDMAAVITEVAAELGDQAPPGVSTVYRWLKDYRTAGGNPRSLVPATERRGNRSRRFPPVVLDIMTAVINERYLKLEQPSARETYFAVINRVTRHNAQLPAAEHVTVPKLKAFYRELNNMDPYDRAVGRKGQRAADLEFKIVGPGPRTSRPLERVECDHTKLDLFVIDERTEAPIGRPWLTILIDHYSRMPVGYYLGFIVPSFASVLLALRNAVLPKTWLKERFPDIEGNWPCYGVPDMIVVDNGREFHSRHFETACLALGIEIQHAVVRCPWYKGAVERFFGNVNRTLLGGQPGRTFPPYIRPEDYDPRKNAVITLAELDRLLCQWIVEDYGMKLHTGTGIQPRHRWDEGFKRWTPRLIGDRDDLDVMLACSERRIIGNRGIEMARLHYRSEPLQNLRRRLPKGQAVEFRYNPNNLLEIQVQDPETSSFFAVPLSPEEQDYATNLGLWAHRAIVRHARATEEGRIDIVALARSKEKLIAMVAAIQEKRTRTGARMKAARFLEDIGRPAMDSGGAWAEADQVAPSWSQLEAPPVLPPPNEDEDWGVDF